MLLIDDNDDQRAALAGALRERGWLVETARCAREGLEAAQRIRPDVVLTELILPDARGLQYANALRSLIGRETIVIALTRLPALVHELARTAGFDHVQGKPVDPDDLHGRLMALA